MSAFAGAVGGSVPVRFWQAGGAGCGRGEDAVGLRGGAGVKVHLGGGVGWFPGGDAKKFVRPRTSLVQTTQSVYARPGFDARCSDLKVESKDQIAGQCGLLVSTSERGLRCIHPAPRRPPARVYPYVFRMRQRETPDGGNRVTGQVRNVGPSRDRVGQQSPLWETESR